MMKMFASYHWPGNIREMENLVKRYVIFGSEEIVASALQSRATDQVNIPAGDEPVSLKMLTREATKRFEQEIIRKVLSDNRWSRKKTAKKLNMSYRALLYKLKDAGINSHEDRAGNTEK
jgi:two-component system response regulator AtoC